MVDISVSHFFTCAALGDGSAWCWGYGAWGVLGYGSLSTSHTPVQVVGLSGVAQLAAAFTHTCAVVNDGTVWCWGTGMHGELGNGSYVMQGQQPLPVQVSGLSSIARVAATWGHNCAVATDGSVWCWGVGSAGRLGYGGTADQLTPVQVIGLGNAVSVSVGSHGSQSLDGHSCALIDDGTIWCWGGNSCGQLGDGSSANQLTPVQVVGVASAVDVAAGKNHTCTVLDDGSAKCWGCNSQGAIVRGQLGYGGSNDQQSPVQVLGLSSAIGISAGNYYSCAWQADRTAWCWGYNNPAVLGVDGHREPRVSGDQRA